MKTILECFELMKKLHLSKTVLLKNDCYIDGEMDYSGDPDFVYNYCLYSFATLVFKKNLVC